MLKRTKQKEKLPNSIFSYAKVEEMLCIAFLLQFCIGKKKRGRGKMKTLEKYSKASKRFKIECIIKKCSIYIYLVAFLSIILNNLFFFVYIFAILFVFTVVLHFN